MKKRITVLGSTGSIGVNTLAILRDNPDKFQVIGLAARDNVDFMEKQAREFRPKIVSLFDEKQAECLKKRLKNTKIDVKSGEAGAVEIAAMEKSDMVVSAMAGSAGLIPTLKAIENKKNIALANKETLVMAGEIIMKKIKKGGKLIPVDSEHNAIFQSLIGNRKDHIRKLILTASGGPFAKLSLSKLKNISVKEALNHPKWQMGKKVSIDSATMMNKGLEVIEAKWLFGVDVEKIEVLIHPQSIIHSMVEFTDSSIVGILSYPNMKIPISYALNYPERLENGLPSLDFAKIKDLNFYSPDRKKFPCLDFAYEAIKKGGTMPAVLNASNEIAVEAFLEKKIGFLDISAIIRKTMNKHSVKKSSRLKDILEADQWAKEEALAGVRELKKG